MYQSFELMMQKCYQNNNPNILSRIKSDIRSGKEFHYLFVGKVGTGKTLLAREIYKQFRNQNPNIEHSFSRARELYRHYLSVMMSSYTDKGDAIKRAIRCFRSQFAVLDDIGAEKPRTEASRMFIEDILEDRYDFAKMYPCCSIITTNLTGEEIGQLYGHRVLDRLHEIFTIMVFNDHSFRQDHTEIIEG